MEIKKYNVGKTQYTFVCETWETSSAWGHKVTMFRNDYEETSVKIRYYNRTWECFRYQTCILKAIETTAKEYKDIAVRNYKYSNNVSRLKQEIKEKLWQENEILQELEDLYNQIRNGNR